MSYIGQSQENATANLAAMNTAIESVPYSRRSDFLNILVGGLSNHLSPELFAGVVYRALEPFGESDMEMARR